MGNVCHYSLEKFRRPAYFPKHGKVIHIKLLYCQLYGCEICSLTLREEQRFSMLENKILGANCEEITG